MERMHSDFKKLEKANKLVTFTQEQIDYICWYIASNRIDHDPTSPGFNPDIVAAAAMWSSGQIALLKQLQAVNQQAARSQPGGGSICVRQSSRL